jgi:hypothetical protein
LKFTGLETSSLFIWVKECPLRAYRKGLLGRLLNTHRVAVDAVMASTLKLRVNCMTSGSAGGWSLNYELHKMEVTIQMGLVSLSTLFGFRNPISVSISSDPATSMIDDGRH